MEGTNLPTDIRDLILSFHEPWPFHHTELVQEFKELVAGHPRTHFSMLWFDWWGADLRLFTPYL